MIGIFLSFAFIVALFVYKGIKIVPQQQAWIVEKLGRFDRKLEPGLQCLIPFIDKVAYRHSLKEYAHDIQEQTAITRDNVSLIIDGVIYLRIIDPVQASYGVSDPIFAVTQLAQTTMRSEIGKLTLDQSFEEREALNTNIVNAINDAAQTWGVQCMRYEIKNINPPASVLKAMETQVAAERKKRAEILESEGSRQAKINIAEAEKRQVELASEAAKIDQINRAEGEAAAILSVAEANAQGIAMVAQAILQEGGKEAVSLKVAEQYVASFGKLAKESTTILLPANAGDAGSMVAQALGVFDAIRHQKGGGNTAL
ncbi:MAG: paraslipin [Alphaproteobacteria bacterium]|nr:MAG: paraslipin [Alphaproteobacteria bacterium]TAF15499.1 MAG: paraslipin [Alphaproteobacteria bacterium]TAF40950.1 MAG: paraslipin [Alphaproteobacteria bacterium]